MASNMITKEIESRLKQSPEHLFEVFLEIHQPIKTEAPEILIQYPETYSDEILKTAAKFAYPCSNLSFSSDDLNENYTFVILDSTGSIFRFGFCRRSNREMTCLCLLSYYPCFEMFYHILNDLSRMINSKSGIEVECFLSDLYNYKFLSNNQGKELIFEKYLRPDLDELPSIPSNLNFSILFSQLHPNLIIQLFAHLLFERRILFVSSKLFHLSACACACLQLINPMHWQNIFLPILPESMSWTIECTAPYIIGVHKSIYSKLNTKDLDDVVIVDIERNRIQTLHDDLKIFPKYLIKQMKNDLEKYLKFTGDHLARIFFRTIESIVGNYGKGFVRINDRLDFSRDVYLREYQGTEFYSFMSSIVNTQMFEQFSRYRTSIEVKKLDQPLIDFANDDISLLPPPLISQTIPSNSQTIENNNNNNNNTNDMKNLIDQFDPLNS